MLNSLPVKWLHLLASGVVALVGVALGIGALACLLMLTREDSVFVTWRAVVYVIAAASLGSGAGACMKRAAKLLETAEQKKN